MVHPSIIEARLGELRFHFSRWFRAEVHELQHILMDHEKIIACACGRYFGSFALLVATDQRLLLIDKRVFFMTIEDTRYDMISEIDFNSQAYYANLTVFTVNKTHKFTSIKHRHQLRDLTHYVQRRVMEFRNQQSAVMSGSAVEMPVAAAPVPAEPAYSQLPPATEPVAAAPLAAVPAAPPPGVAQRVGSAVMQVSHRPINPYVQGSLMARHPIVSSRPAQY